MRIDRRVLRKLLPPVLTVAILFGLVGPAYADVTFHMHPRSGPPGTTVHLRGSGLSSISRPCSLIGWWIIYSDTGGTSLIAIVPDETGSFRAKAAIAETDPPGMKITFALGYYSRSRVTCDGHVVARRRFTVTQPSPPDPIEVGRLLLHRCQNNAGGRGHAHPWADGLDWTS
jgi:hypothetical protein